MKTDELESQDIELWKNYMGLKKFVGGGEFNNVCIVLYMYCVAKILNFRDWNISPIWHRQ